MELALRFQEPLQNGIVGEEDRTQQAELDERRSFREFPPEKIEPKPVDLAQALTDSRFLVILGAPGSGKTTMSRWLALTFAEKRQADSDRLGQGFEKSRIPVLIELRRLAPWIEKPNAWPGEEGVVSQTGSVYR